MIEPISDEGIAVLWSLLNETTTTTTDHDAITNAMTTTRSDAATEPTTTATTATTTTKPTGQANAANDTLLMSLTTQHLLEMVE